MGECSICYETLQQGMVITNCGHAYCPDCIFNSIAKNTGTEQGTSRNLCPICRAPLCDPIEPDELLEIRLDYNKERIIKLTEDLNDNYTEIIDLENSLLQMECKLKGHKGTIIKYRKKTKLQTKQIKMLGNYIKCISPKLGLYTLDDLCAKMIQKCYKTFSNKKYTKLYHVCLKFLL